MEEISELTSKEIMYIIHQILSDKKDKCALHLWTVILFEWNSDCEPMKWKMVVGSDRDRLIIEA